MHHGSRARWQQQLYMLERYEISGHHPLACNLLEENNNLRDFLKYIEELCPMKGTFHFSKRRQAGRQIAEGPDVVLTVLVHVQKNLQRKT